MNVDYKKIDLIEDINKIEYQNIKDDKKIYLSICLHTDKFKEYQKNLFNDFYSKVLELLEKNSIFLDFKKSIESEIKQFNTQLKIFQEKINIDYKIDIRWIIQIIRKETYISALIWESSIIIFRDEKLESVITNEIEDEDKIDIFWEIVEWELENKDKIISMCTNIYNYMTDNEIKDIISTENVLETLNNIITTRVQKEEIWKIEELNISIEKIKFESKKEFNLNKYANILKKHKYTIWIMIAISIIFFVIFSIFSYMGSNKKQVVEIWWKQIEVSLENLKRQIDTFSKFDFWNNNDVSTKKIEYEKIIEELDMFEKNNIQTLEIKELRKKVEQNYYKGFNINLISKNDGLLQNIYNFSKEELEQLSWTKQIFKSSLKLDVVWEKWTLLWIIDNNYKWTLQKINIPTKIKTCTTNLDWNWLYCVMEDDIIYNISKYWITSIKNSQWNWPKNIVSIATYGTNKMYILTKDKNLNDKWIYIVRYVLNNKDNFWSSTNYVFIKKTDKKLIDSITTDSNMDIDGTFIIWNKDGILQAYRNDNLSNNMNLRQIPWWDNALIDDKKDFSWKRKIISNVWSNYIHIFDFATNSLVTYLTSPYKTNTSSIDYYKLIYKYKVKFVFDNEIIENIIVNYNNTTKKQIAYILTDKWIYSIDLWQFSN